ncbi:MAG: phosphohydrolase, partial [bacterium]|nr:phosphohydrolase [bacterium]
QYRYPGPKPQSREAAIILLADAVEAASRTLDDPSYGHIQELVTRIINNKFIDGQLEECDLSLKDIHTIGEQFCHVLSGMFHNRVDYPAEDKRK